MKGHVNLCHVRLLLHSLHLLLFLENLLHLALFLEHALHFLLLPKLLLILRLHFLPLKAALRRVFGPVQVLRETLFSSSPFSFFFLSL